MTVEQYLTQVLGNFGFKKADFSFLLIGSELGLSDELDSDNLKILKTATHSNFPVIYAQLSKVKEGDLSIEYNMKGIELWYSSLCSELGLEDMFRTSIKAVNKW